MAVTVPPVPIKLVGEVTVEVGDVTVEVWFAKVPPVPEMLEGEEEFAHVLPLPSSFTM